MNDPAAHEAHDLPLTHRIIAGAIMDWLNSATAIARAANGNPPINDYERGVSQGIDRMRHLHLDNYWYTLVPEIADELQRANLLVQPQPALWLSWMISGMNWTPSAPAIP